MPAHTVEKRDARTAVCSSAEHSDGRHSATKSTRQPRGVEVRSIAVLVVAFALMVAAYLLLSAKADGETPPVEGTAVGTSALGCTVTARPYTGNPWWSAADFVCTKEALVERVCRVNLSTMDKYFSDTGETFYVGFPSYSNTIRYDHKSGQLDCYTEAGYHTFTWGGQDWRALTQAGDLPTELASRLGSS